MKPFGHSTARKRRRRLSGYTLYMPVVGWYSPNGSYTEGSGVEPDVLVDIDPEALARRSDAQLDRALDILQ